MTMPGGVGVMDPSGTPPSPEAWAPRHRGWAGYVAWVLFLLPAGCQSHDSPVLGAALDAVFLDGIRLALEERGGPGVLLPDTILLEESSNRSRPALDAATRLVARPGVVAVIGHSNSSASVSASQVYNRARVVQIAPTATSPIYSEAGAYSFRMVPPDQVQGAALARTLRDSLPSGATLAILHVNDDYGRGLRHHLLEGLASTPLQVVVDLPHTEADISALDEAHLLEAMAHAEPDAVVWLGRWQILAGILPRIREVHGEIPIFGGDGVAPVAVRTDRDPAWDRVLYLDFLDLDSTPELLAFQTRFEARFGRPPGAGEALSYDAASVVLAALAAGAGTGEEVRDFLESLGREIPSHPGVTGALTFHPSGDVTRSFVLKRMPSRGAP